MIADKLGYISEKESTELLDAATSVGRALAGLINAVKNGDRVLATDQRPTTNDHHV